MRARKALTLLMCLAVGWAAVACGGDDEQTSSVTKAQFIKRADAICEKADEEQLAAIAKLPKGSSEAQIVATSLGVTQEQAEQIAALPMPSGDERQIEAFVAAMEAAVDEAQGKSNPTQITGPFEKPDRLASAYGFTACNEAL